MEKKSYLGTQIYSEVVEICKPFFDHLKINYFGYGKAYFDGSLVDISTNGEWVDHFRNQAYTGIGFAGNSFESGYYTLRSGLNDLMPEHQFIVAAEAFNMNHPLVVVKKYKDFYEYSLIATNKENYKIYDFYLNNIDIIDRMLFYFKDKASTIIKETEKSYIPSIYKETFKQSFKIRPQSNIRELILQDTQPNRFYIHIGEHEIILSAKQFECVIDYIKGESLKGIARKLDCSVRTVEHYLNIVQRKMSCFSRSQMVEQFLKAVKLSYLNR